MWNTNDLDLWQSALNRYLTFVKASNLELEKEMDRLDAQTVKAMNPKAWFEFLLEKYFRWKYTAPNRYGSTTKILRTYAANNELAALHGLRSAYSRRTRTTFSNVWLLLLQEQLSEKSQWQDDLYRLVGEAEERAEASETRANASGFRIQQLEAQIASRGGTPDESVHPPASWDEFSDWCDEEFAGRIILAPQARKSVKSPVFEDVELTGRCLLWLANAFRTLKLEGADGPLRDLVLESGITNARCGNDTFDIEWQGKKHRVEWHIKNGGNTHDPKRCLRIYYFWDETSLQTVIASMPAHIRTEAT